MSPPDDDPASRFTFDEDFIRGAQFKEPSARQRGRPPRRPRRPARDDRRQELVRARKRFGPWIPAAAVLVIGGWSVFGLPVPFFGKSGTDKKSEQRAAGTGDAPATSTTFSLAGVEYRPGDCVIWDQQAGEARRRDTRVVPCGEPHFIEITGRVNLAQLGDYPTEAEWKDIKENRDCPRVAEQYLGYPLDPDGRFDANGMAPYPETWAQGERYVWCALLATPSAANDDPNQHDRLVGQVKGQDQTRLWGTGACLAEDADHKIVGTVPCTAPHAYEVVGAVRVGSRWSTPPPVTSSEWGSVLGSDCAAQARTYFAGAVPSGVKSNVLPFQPASWMAGRRTAECVAARPDATGRPTTLTSPLRS